MKFTDLKTKVTALEKEHEAKVDALEAQMWADMGIKPEDLYSPEERAQRFDAILTAMIHMPPLPHKEFVKQRRAKKKDV